MLFFAFFRSFMGKVTSSNDRVMGGLYGGLGGGLASSPNHSEDQDIDVEDDEEDISVAGE